MSRTDEILDKLKAIIDPDLGQDIVTLGFIQDLQITDGGDVSFMLQLTTPACPVKERFRSDSETLVAELPWVNKVVVSISSKSQRSPLANVKKGLENVQNIIAVASCKGGVGKSTLAVNLAYTLAAKGAAVGIFDADIYGPSLPTLVATEFNGLFQKNDRIMPVESNGVKLMSFAYANPDPDGGPAILRGPMVTQIINQLLTGTDWGSLDYLVVDMPPGTGDIQLTLSQIIPITAAVIVTTPQQLSFVDVVKGIQMFQKMKIPTVAVIENMSYHLCGQCNTKHHLFGTGSRSRLVEQFGIKNSFELPIDPELSRCSDSGSPFIIEHPESSVTAEFSDIADAVIREVSTLTFGDNRSPVVEYQPGSGILFRNGSGESVTIQPAALRRSCRCAVCVNEMTGERVLKDSEIDDAVVPNSISPMGNYASAIQWSDGHSSIFPYDAIQELAQS